MTAGTTGSALQFTSLQSAQDWPLSDGRDGASYANDINGHAEQASQHPQYHQQEHSLYAQSAYPGGTLESKGLPSSRTGNKTSPYGQQSQSSLAGSYQQQQQINGMYEDEAGSKQQHRPWNEVNGTYGIQSTERIDGGARPTRTGSLPVHAAPGPGYPTRNYPPADLSLQPNPSEYGSLPMTGLHLPGSALDPALSR